MAEFHDRLDLKLNVLQYTQPTCGSLNLATGKAEYCGYGCPTLRRRWEAGEDADQPLNERVAGLDATPFDPAYAV